MESPPDCPLCPQNGLLNEEIIAHSSNAYLIPAHSSSGNFLIIPYTHVELPMDLANDWWKDCKDLLSQVPGLGVDYNISLNFGAVAGQTVKHLHFWIIPRAPGQAASGKGFARLIAETNERPN